jgi:hypothetical protein
MFVAQPKTDVRRDGVRKRVRGIPPSGTVKNNINTSGILQDSHRVLEHSGG